MGAASILLALGVGLAVPPSDGGQLDGGGNGAAGKAPSTSVTVTDLGEFTISVAGVIWLQSPGALRAHVDGGWHVPTHFSTARATGVDPQLGRFDVTNVSWVVGPRGVVLSTSIRVFSAGAGAGPLPPGPAGAPGGGPPRAPTAVIWATEYPHGATGTRDLAIPPLPNSSTHGAKDNGAYPPGVPFPAFTTAPGSSSLESLGYVTWSGTYPALRNPKSVDAAP